MTTYHKEHLLDRAAMVLLRTTLAVQPKLEFVPEARPDFDGLMEKTPVAEGVTYEAAEIGGVAGWWCKPQDSLPGSVIVYFHGGAYVLGSATAYRNFVGQMAASAGVATFIVDYRLAPEHLFPAAVDDAKAVYLGLAASGFSRLVIAGDSGGGGLALALLLLTTAAVQTDNLPKPLAAVVISPWTDLALTGDSLAARAGADPLLTREALDGAAQLYVGDRDRRDPKASPLYGNMSGLPPVLFHVGEDEILLDDSRRFASRIEAVGGVAELHIWEGMTHVFASNIALQSSKVALDNIGEFLRRTFNNAYAHRPEHHHPTEGASDSLGEA
ncbi:6-hexanolactone hydrolase [Acidisarcina polymorpha]|uniref:6-hexanolactone hydrolase n=1 Tax=Acidisarcina polymorpha TaxID=2211140 RepID=A0A2Z5FYN4_9BACT|nr:alpha/beta hydrolase [Acidisarcina polymorpha]AXC11958.1 6-hexanolactone hydrolase [Acidisarcina polymorpha]